MWQRKEAQKKLKHAIPFHGVAFPHGNLPLPQPCSLSLLDGCSSCQEPTGMLFVKRYRLYRQENTGVAIPQKRKILFFFRRETLLKSSI
jgi:hypothetical protein